jgi:hypothetical protein
VNRKFGAYLGTEEAEPNLAKSMSIGIDTGMTPEKGKFSIILHYFRRKEEEANGSICQVPLS